jgi:hypothetical protein
MQVRSVELIPVQKDKQLADILLERSQVVGIQNFSSGLRLETVAILKLHTLAEMD